LFEAITQGGQLLPRQRRFTDLQDASIDVVLDAPGETATDGFVRVALRFDFQFGNLEPQLRDTTANGLAGGTTREMAADVNDGFAASHCRRDRKTPAWPNTTA
jgi:hypothetical protein